MNAAPKSTLNQTIQLFALQFEQQLNQFGKFIKSSLYLELTPLQASILKVLVVLLLGTTTLLWYYWNAYGKVITEKFVRPSTLKEIEELKLSVAKLKLPKEHSPRI